MTLLSALLMQDQLVRLFPSLSKQPSDRATHVVAG